MDALKDYKWSVILLALTGIVAATMTWWLVVPLVVAAVAVFMHEKMQSEHRLFRDCADDIWTLCARHHPQESRERLNHLVRTEGPEALQSFADSVFAAGFTSDDEERGFRGTLRTISDLLRKWGNRPIKGPVFKRFLYREIGNPAHERTLRLVEHLERSRAREMGESDEQGYLKKIRGVWIDERARQLMSGSEEAEPPTVA